MYESDIDGTFNFSPAEMQKHSRAFLKIQDGCNNMCSYCKIPLARGPSRSRSLDDILTNIDKLQQNGYEEIILTGINLGTWRYESQGLPYLINTILKQTGNLRLRIGSIEPPYITDAFLQSIASDRVCNHFHIPLQSGSNKILQLMNRTYTTEQYQSCIDSIRRVKQDPFISSDLIIGFPGSTKKTFQETVQLVEKTRFSFIHLFSFSPRKGTKAADMDGKVPERVTRQRMKIMAELVEKQNLEYKKRYIGTTLKTIIEKTNEKMVTGRTDNYLEVLLTPDPSLVSRKTRLVTVTDMNDSRLFGKLIGQ
jgi:threonylcarbamoyladenosine tRNA methylthiotransferase MtaB